MSDKIKQFMQTRTIAFQIQLVLGATTLIFWHLYTGYEFVSQIRRDLQNFDHSIATQMEQFIADNHASMELFDYERIRANAGRLSFPYPVKSLVVFGQYGEKIYERGQQDEVHPLFKRKLTLGSVSMTKDFKKSFSFEQPFGDLLPSEAVVRGVLDLNPMVKGVVGELSSRYLFGMALFVLQVVLISVCAKKMTSPLEQFAKKLRAIEGELPIADKSFAKSSEMAALVTAYNEGIRKQSDLRVRVMEAERKAGQARLAAQVAHDLASPLTSLKVAMNYFSKLKIQEEAFSTSFNLLSLSSKRLEEIAGVLLKEYRGGAREVGQKISVHRILDELIGEYQAQYEGIQFIKLYYAENLFIEAPRGKITRAFNNLIKNGVEAMGGKGNFSFVTEVIDNQISVTFRDTGIGMSPELIQMALLEEVTFGKRGGHGIGLSVVKEALKECHGRMEIHSPPQGGTAFTLRFPQTESKKAFAFAELGNSITIVVDSDDPIIVVEDDQIFKDRWKTLLLEQRREALFFESYEAVEASHVGRNESRTAIVDFHFKASTRNGFDVVRLLRERGVEHFTLCTGDYWRPDIQREARLQGVQLCPKPLPQVEIEVREGRNASSV